MRTFTVNHLLTFDMNASHAPYGLVCAHETGDPYWQCVNDDGTVESDLGCWLQTWWDNLGEYLLAKDGWPEQPSFPMPVIPHKSTTIDRQDLTLRFPEVFHQQ